MANSEGKVALVTGASSGIGEATARRLSEAGYVVYAGARRVERMRGLAEGGLRVGQLDVTDDASMVDFVERAVAETGRVDVLVNNAGYGSYGALEDVPLAEARRQFEVNVFGLARMTQLVLPHMRAHRHGYVVNISSIGGKFWEPLGSWYHATKFAVEGLSDSLRVELRPHGVHVVIIEPGSISTEWTEISAEHAARYSAEGPYAAQAAGLARVLAPRRDGRPIGSSPEAVAKVIVRAVGSRHPRTRYAVGSGGKPITYARRLLPDQIIDLAVGRLYRPEPISSE
ncbi:MAG TPA: oxidoreductase [Actinomycetes bacterium]|nr:oxidoreductase [Actinomycetes bacterium]